MNKIKTLIFLFLIVSNYGCSQQNKNEKLNFKNTIELSIESTSNKINPLISKMNVRLNERKSDAELMNMYNESKLSIVLNKEMINKLTEVDSEINLKEGAILYLENCEKILDGFILPAIKYLNESQELDKAKMMETFALFETTINQTASLSDSLEQFCNKYKLPREMSDFEKDELMKRIEEAKIKLKIKN